LGKAYTYLRMAALETEKASREDLVEAVKHNSFTVMLPRVIAGIFLILLITWVEQAEGGFGFQEANIFGLHALFMGFVVVLFLQESILCWTVPIPILTSRRARIIFHLVCNFCALTFSVLGVVAIAYYKKLSPTPTSFPFYTAYSPHSWVGIVFLILFAFQSVLKLIGEKHPPMLLAKAHHRFLGHAIYVTGLACCAMGFEDMQCSDLASSSPPSMAGMSMGGMSMNMSGMDMSGMDMSNATMSGYYPDSELARIASAASVMLVLQGLATFFTHVKA